MAQTELLNSISKSIDYPVEQNLSASYHCGTFSLIVDTDLWTEQMYYELPWIQLDIYITVGGIDIKYLSCNIMLDTDEPKKPYSVSVYGIPGSFKVKLTPGFDDNVITTHNELCLQEDISNTWGPQTLEFPCSVVWDDSNISSSSGGGGGGGGSVTPADLCTYTIIRSTDSNYAAIYKLQQTKNSISTFVGDTINIPKDMVIQSGTVETCEHNDVPIIGYVVGDKYLDLIISNSSNEHIYILLNDLVDLSASNISYNNSNSGLDSTNVNNAIDELSSKKVDKEIGKVLSSNDYTTFEKNKLNEIEIGAEVNVQSDWTQTDSSSDDFIKNKPTNLSQFTNDYEFITNDTSSLTNYYKKSDTLSTVEINGILEDKVDKITGKRLSTNDFTNELLNKLNAVDETAEPNVQSDWNQENDTQDDYIKNKPSINDVKVVGELDSVDDLKIAGKIVTNTQGAEIFNDYENNEATGQKAHAEGSGTTASGAFSHAEGSETTASGAFSHAEGSETTASGAFSHAEGGQTTASEAYSHAEGRETTASGYFSHAEGGETTASGDFSHAEGSGTTASGTNAHAEGLFTKASSGNQHVQGKFNREDTQNKYAFIIGNGTSDSERSNAFAIDWDGNIYINNSETGINLPDADTVYTKSETDDLLDDKTNKSTKVSFTLAAADWNNTTNTVSLVGVTNTNVIDVSVATTITSAQLNALLRAIIVGTSQSTNSITLTAFGEVPTIDIPLVAVIRRDL